MFLPEAACQEPLTADDSRTQHPKTKYVKNGAEYLTHVIMSLETQSVVVDSSTQCGALIGSNLLLPRPTGLFAFMTKEVVLCKLICGGNAMGLQINLCSCQPIVLTHEECQTIVYLIHSTQHFPCWLQVVYLVLCNNVVATACIPVPLSLRR
jgi:hypothetical protein